MHHRPTTRTTTLSPDGMKTLNAKQQSSMRWKRMLVNSRIFLRPCSWKQSTLHESPCCRCCCHCHRRVWGLFPCPWNGCAALTLTSALVWKVSKNYHKARCPGMRNFARKSFNLLPAILREHSKRQQLVPFMQHLRGPVRPVLYGWCLNDEGCSEEAFWRAYITTAYWTQQRRGRKINRSLFVSS